MSFPVQQTPGGIVDIRQRGLGLIQRGFVNVSLQSVIVPAPVFRIHQKAHPFLKGQIRCGGIFYLPPVSICHDAHAHLDQFLVSWLVQHFLSLP
jgi:hypothetical protein